MRNVMKNPGSKLFLLLAFGLAACGNEDKEQSTVTPPNGLEDAFVSDVIEVEEKHLNAEYWVDALPDGAGDVIFTTDEIKAMNAASISGDPTMFDLRSFPDSLSGDEVRSRLRSISNVPSYPRVYMNGNPVREADFEAYEASLNLDAIAEEVPLTFALAVRRTPLRTYPTMDRIFSEGASNTDIDRFQESTLFPTDIMAVLHESADGQWALVQTYNYIAWVQRQDIATGNRDELFAYKDAKDVLVMTGAKVRTVYNPVLEDVSELQLDMGVAVPLDRPKEFATNLYGQNPYVHHMVKLPVRLDDGSVAFRHALISRVEDVRVGYLPFTRANIIRQAFKFLGERYGWGHSYNGRDCTGFVSEVYRSMGILMPRNSGDQGKSVIGVNSRFEKDTPRAEKEALLRASLVGDLVYIPGHVMMVLGHEGDRPFVIHDVTGLGYLANDGSIYDGTLNGVSITPLLTLQSSKDRTYVDAVYNVKSIK